jgi:glycosyltransferase involved in cell wall biosynthesis
MKVSICIPTYQSPETLRRCVASILLQDFNDYEIIITDDSQNDDLKDISNIDPRIKYIKNEYPLGSPENWNKAISYAQGEYIKIMHHDDWFSNQTSLSQFVKSLDYNPQSLFVFSGCSDIGLKNIKREISSKNSGLLKKNTDILFRNNIIGSPSVTMYRNNSNIQFDKNLIWLVDVDFYFRILNNNRNFVTIFDSLVNIGISENQTTNKCINNEKIILNEYLYVYKKFTLGKNKSNILYLLNLFAKYKINSNKKINTLDLSHKYYLNISSLFIIIILQIRNTIIQNLKKIFILKENEN